MNPDMMTYLRTWFGLSFWGVIHQPPAPQIATWIALTNSNIQPKNLPPAVVWEQKGSRDAFWDWLCRSIDDRTYLDSRRELDV